jgi:hypothetical protein
MGVLLLIHPIPLSLSLGTEIIIQVLKISPRAKFLEPEFTPLPPGGREEAGKLEDYGNTIHGLINAPM